jgi:hypothetical protein
MTMTVADFCLHDRVDLTSCSQLLHPKARQFLSHGGNEGFRIGHLVFSCSQSNRNKYMTVVPADPTMRP